MALTTIEQYSANTALANVDVEHEETGDGISVIHEPSDVSRPSLFSRPPVKVQPEPLRAQRPSALRRRNLHGLGAIH